MKTNKLSALLVASMLFLSNGSFADNGGSVSQEKARDIAAYHIAIVSGSDQYKASDAHLVKLVSNPLTGEAVAYIFNVGGHSHAVVAGNKVARPVIGFSTEDSLNVENMPPAMRWWIDAYCDMIAAVVNEGGVPDKETLSIWESYENHSLIPDLSKATSFLIDTKWGQGSNSNPTYNLYCPKVNNQYCYTGCVPTALAQILRYYEYPKVGQYTRTFYPPTDNGGTSAVGQLINFGNTHYDYDKMPVKIYSNSDSAEIKAVATLMFHLGVSMDAEYGTDATSAASANAPTRMRAYFKYRTGNYVQRASFASSDAFLDTLRAHIDKKEPVYYAAGSPVGDSPHAEGHAFICDGYRTISGNPNMFHINWGWDQGGAWYDNGLINGQLTGLSINGMVFSVDQRVILNMTPPDDSNHVSITVAGTEDGVALYPAYPNPAFYQVTIPYHMSDGMSSVLQIYDVTGRQMEEIAINGMQDNAYVNVSAYPKGIYLYRIKGGKEMRKFIVQ